MKSTPKRSRTGATGDSGNLAAVENTPAAATLHLGGSLDASLGYAIRQAQIRAYQLFTAFMREWTIRPAQYALLVLIHENKAITQSIAGNVLGIEKANMAGLLAELHHLGYVERRSLATDRRAYSLHLTTSGKALMRKLLKRHDEYEKALASGLAPGERERLLTLLGQVTQPQE